MKGRITIETMEDDKRLTNDNSPHDLVECPSLSDVIFKSGTSSLSHPGNVKYKEVLEAHYNAYCEAGVGSSKHAVLASIIHTVHQKGGRFLDWSKTCSCWVVIQDSAQIRLKVYNSIFAFHKSMQAKMNCQNNTSSTFMFERQDGKRRRRNSNGEEPSCCS